jgi:uncharacterized membrane protein (DUF485 family)
MSYAELAVVYLIAFAVMTIAFVLSTVNVRKTIANCRNLKYYGYLPENYICEEQ